MILFYWKARSHINIDISPKKLCHSSTKLGEKKVKSKILSLLSQTLHASSWSSWKPFEKMQRSSLRISWLQSTITYIKTNNKFPCLAYERTFVQCLNNYGVRGSQEVPECNQMAVYFNQCVSINKYFAAQKKMNPEHFAESDYSRDRHNLSDIGLWSIWINNLCIFIGESIVKSVEQLWDTVVTRQSVYFSSFANKSQGRSQSVGNCFMHLRCWDWINFIIKVFVCISCIVKSFCPFFKSSCCWCIFSVYSSFQGLFCEFYVCSRGISKSCKFLSSNIENLFGLDQYKNTWAADPEILIPKSPESE